jgi:hypothetical protein
MCLLALPANAKYSGGTGEPNDPYQIATAADLIALGETPEDYDKHFILTADIDLDPNLPGRRGFYEAVIAPHYDTPFTGVFDGDVHKISHLTISRGGGYVGVGLFGRLGSTGRVSNLRLETVQITLTGGNIGGLVGWNNGGSITNCHSSGLVCTTGSSVSLAGGLVGCNEEGSITSSSSGGVVCTTGSNSLAGGLVGSNYEGGKITNCCSTGSVSTTGSSSLAGGLVAYNSGRITNCYSSALVSTTGQYSHSAGFVANNYGSIATSYSSGIVSGTGYYVGGLVGEGSPDRVSTCVWNAEISTLSQSAGGVGLTTADMMDPEMLGLNGFGNDPNWVLDAGHDYPRLAWEGTTGSMIPEPAVDWLEGQGIAEAPYRIDTAEQLILLGKASVLWSDHFILGADIDLDPNLPGSMIFGQAVIPAFHGIFDGGGHVIANLTIEGRDYLGLFGCLVSNAEVKNVRVVDVNVTALGSYIGGLLGNNSGDITTSYSSGSVRGYHCVGGLVGWNSGSVVASYGTGTVSGDFYTGGLVGSNFGSVVESYATGTISGTEGVGGLVGWNTDCIATCYSSGSVSGATNVGGLVGLNAAPGLAHGKGDIATSYSSNEVAGDCCVGGLVGKNGGCITNCYSSGLVSGTTNVGGLVGDNYIWYESEWEITSSFWDVESSGQPTNDGGTGRTTAEMQTAGTFLEAGWDFVGETVNGTEDVWKIVEGQTYPLLSWQKYSGGSGTAEDPYQIATAADLIALGEAPNDYDEHFLLTADIDLDPNLDGGKVFDKAVIAPDTDPYDWHPFEGPLFTGVPFTGAFDGNGHAISNLTIIGGNYLGLFGQLGATTNVSHLGLVAVEVSGTGDFVGGLVGHNRGGSLARSHSSGAVGGRGYVGGLVGRIGDYYADEGGDVTECWSAGVVSGDYCIGGLAGGSSYGPITNCYSSGSVSGGSSVGGLVGSSSPDRIATSYSSASVSGNSWVGGLVGSRYYDGISSSFWDIETSGQRESAGGVGKTTAEMQMAKTFLDAGWDFVGETANGTADIWWILEGKDYPRLWWEQSEQP